MLYDSSFNVNNHNENANPVKTVIEHDAWQQHLKIKMLVLQLQIKRCKRKRMDARQFKDNYTQIIL